MKNQKQELEEIISSNQAFIGRQTCTEEEQISAIPWLCAQSVLNSLFCIWTFGGSIFLLYLNELGLPNGQIGAVLSIFPFCGLLALGFAPLAQRWGWKRVYLLGYGIRNFVMAMLLLLPWVMIRFGNNATMIFLFVVIIVFALLRAFSETAYFPWSKEFTPKRLWGRINGINTVICTVTAGLGLWLAGYVINQGAGLTRFQVLLGAGCIMGLLNVIMIVKMPGGKPHTGLKTFGSHGTNMMQALRDRNFITFMAGSGCVTIGNLLFMTFLPLHIKEGMGIAPGTVVMLDIAVMVGLAISSLILGWAADRVGSRPVLMPAAVMCLLIPLGWLMLPRQTPNAVAWCAIMYLMYGIATGGINIGANRLLFNGVIPDEESTVYTAIYYAWMGITCGIAPLLAAGILSVSGIWQVRIGTLKIDGYSLLFFFAALLLTAGWWLYGRVKPDGHHTTRTVIRQLFEPIFPRWITQALR